MNEPTVLDLFSGIGGFSLAFEAEGFRTIGFAEIDPYASAVLRKHWPDVPNLGDVKSADDETIASLGDYWRDSDMSRTPNPKYDGARELYGLRYL